MQERLPAIASSHAHHESIPDMADEAVEWLSTGLQGMKVGFGKRGNARLGFEHDRDVEYVRAMREAIGPGKMLMIDLGWLIRWDVSTAIKRTRAFDEYGIDWIEEPLGDWDPRRPPTGNGPGRAPHIAAGHQAVGTIDDQPGLVWSSVSGCERRRAPSYEIRYVIHSCLSFASLGLGRHRRFR